MQKHNKNDPEDAVKNITANLVVDFLKDQEHVAIASELLKLDSKTDLPNLHGLKLADLVSYFSETKIPSDNCYINGIVASLVIDFLKDQDHDGIASDLKSVFATLNLPELHGLKLADLFSYFQKNEEEKVSKCKMSKVAANLHGLKLTDLDQYMSSVKEYPEDELNEWTTIQEAYGGKHEAIKALDNGKSEVAKVLKYILDINIPIKKIHAVTADWKCFTHIQRDNHIIMCISKANRSIAKFFKTGSFSSPVFGKKI
jgi:hypothetical protein